MIKRAKAQWRNPPQVFVATVPPETNIPSDTSPIHFEVLWFVFVVLSYF